MGRFICIEGIEKVGKSTQIAFIAQYLRRMTGKTVTITREPGGTPLGESIRNVLLSSEKHKISPISELLLVFAARAQHITEVIQPALDRGDWVVSDRFTEASYAYQGGGRGLSSGLIHTLEQMVHSQLTVDRVLLLDGPVALSLSRLYKNSSHPLDRIEAESRSFFERVRKVYLERAHQLPERYRIINAAGSISDIQFQIIKALDELIEES